MSLPPCLSICVFLPEAAPPCSPWSFYCVVLTTWTSIRLVVSRCHLTLQHNRNQTLLQNYLSFNHLRLVYISLWHAVLYFPVIYIKINDFLYSQRRVCAHTAGTDIEDNANVESHRGRYSSPRRTKDTVWCLCPLWCHRSNEGVVFFFLHVGVDVIAAAVLSDALFLTCSFKKRQTSLCVY